MPRAAGWNSCVAFVAVVAAIATALPYGLLDLERIERMVLRHVAGDFFRLPTPSEEDEDER